MQEHCEQQDVVCELCANISSVFFLNRHLRSVPFGTTTAEPDPGMFEFFDWLKRGGCNWETPLSGKS
jgi:hypothetical protein